MDSLPDAERYTLFLNPYPDHRFHQCPRCGAQTHERNRVLIVQLEPGTILPVMVTCRFCVSCDILIVHQDELKAELSTILPPENSEAADTSMIVIGTVDRGKLRQSATDGMTPLDFLEAFHPIRELIHFEAVRDEAGHIDMIETELPYPDVQGNVPVPDVEEIRALPQTDETWQVDALRLWAWITDENDQPYRPYLILVVNPAGPFVILQALKPREPSPAELFDALLKAMAHPAMGAGKPRRPMKLITDYEALVEGLAPELAPLNIQCEAGETPELDELIADLEHYLSGENEPVPALLDNPRVTPEQIGELFQAAAAFYREAPWEWMLDEDLIALRYPVPGGEWRFASIMGNAGLEYGVAVFDSLFDYDMIATVPPGTMMGMMDYHALTYDEITAVPFPDLDALEGYGWEVEAADAYPIPLIFTHNEEIERPGPEEIDWYTVCLQAIITFLNDFWPDDIDYVPEPVAVTLTVKLHGRPVQVELRYPAELAEDEF